MSQDASGRRWGRTARASALGVAVLILVSMSSASRGGPLGDDRDGGGLGGGSASPVLIKVDTSVTWLSDGNGVFEPGESVTVAPSWQAPFDQSVQLPGVAMGFSGAVDATYTVTDWTASYGIIPPGQVASCLDTGDCYGLSLSLPNTPRPVHWDATFSETTDSAGMLGAYEWTVHIGDSFSDVPRSNLNYRWVETLLHRGVSSGCGGGQFCPGAELKRDQLAFILLVSKLGKPYVPPACEGSERRFLDVPASNPFCPWIEEVDRRGYVSPCPTDPNLYCPNANVKRGEMARFVLSAAREEGFAPLACGHGPQMYDDVPLGDPNCPWIEELTRDVMLLPGDGGPPVCESGMYCPGLPIWQGDASKLLVGGFHLSTERP